ncbi:MAG: N-acetyltransferase [Planctomycetaceae bacterium]
MEFRNSLPSDLDAIVSLFHSVFTDAEGEQEGGRIAALVREMMTTTEHQDLRGFVAVEAEQIVGAIFFSRLSFDTQIEASILSPVAVKTKSQGQGIGQKLIRYGLTQLQDQHVELVVTYGDPAFYSKVGFRSISPQAIRPPFELSQPEGWLGQSLTSTPVEEFRGHCQCVAALSDAAYW